MGRFNTYYRIIRTVAPTLALVTLACAPLSRSMEKRSLPGQVDTQGADGKVSEGGDNADKKKLHEFHFLETKTVLLNADDYEKKMAEMATSDAIVVIKIKPSESDIRVERLRRNNVVGIHLDQKILMGTTVYFKLNLDDDGIEEVRNRKDFNVNVAKDMDIDSGAECTLTLDPKVGSDSNKAVFDHAEEMALAFPIATLPGPKPAK